MHSKNESIIKYKILYSLIILFIYIVGKSLPLYMIDLTAYVDKSIGTDDLLLQTISGDIYQCHYLTNDAFKTDYHFQLFFFQLSWL